MNAPFEYLKPRSLKAALKLLSEDETRFPIIAGGTDVMVLLRNGQMNARGLIDIWGIDELRGVVATGDDVEIGALTTLSEVIESEEVKAHVPLLCEACKAIGAKQIQNRGTIGGNVMSASPAGDTLPVLAVYEAELKLVSKRGERWVPFNEFYTGYKKTVREPDELLAALRLRGCGDCDAQAFYKIGTRRAQAISKVVAAFRASSVPNEIGKVGRIFIAYGSVAPVPVRAKKTEEFLEGQALNDGVIENALNILRSEISPIDDIRSTAGYRMHIACTLLKRFLREKL